MVHFKLVASKREEIGSRPSGRLRRSGWIPGVVYGPGFESVPIKVNEGELLRIVRATIGETAIVELDLEGKKLLCFVQEVQRHPVTGRVIHVDFMVLPEHEVVEVKVPVKLVGEAVGVKRGGVLDFITHELWVKATPDKIPSHIEVDVSQLDVGDVVHVRDLKPEGYEINEDPDTPIVSILSKAGVEEAEAEEAEAEGEAGGEAAPEGGE